MLDLVRERLAAQLLRTGAQPADVNAAATGLDPNALTIGFARRFATYKRATLLFRNPERLKRILNDPERPVQIIFAGKAHPADEPGKAFIQPVYQYSRQPGFPGKIVFVEDYDTNIARHLVSGVDVWLNNPRRPLEASGTSGEKAGLNGVPNFSVLDGWWREVYDGDERLGHRRGARVSERGRAGRGRCAVAVCDPGEPDRSDSTTIATMHGIPEGWLEIMRASIMTVAPDYSFDRMLKDYLRQVLSPGGRVGQRVYGDNCRAARDLAEWERRVQGGWPQVSISATGPERGEMTMGKPLVVRATLRPGALGARRHRRGAGLRARRERRPGGRCACR